MERLSTRQQSILNRVIDTHIETGEPVGSRHITSLYTAMYRKSYSPATVRNEMLYLEETGYLTHPHTSAGRVPTDRGYRYYVDHSLRLENLSRDMEEQVYQELRHYGEDMDGFAERASFLLSNLAHLMTLVVIPESTRPRKQVFMRGMNYVFEQDDTMDRNVLARFFRFVDAQSELQAWVEERLHREGTQVSIGKENATDAFSHSTVISSQLIVDGQKAGIIVLLGPRRMRYGTTIPFAEGMAQALSRILESKRSGGNERE